MNIAFIAHDEKKQLMVDLTKNYSKQLKFHTVYATGTTGQRIKEATGLRVKRLKSGPFGGDQQIGGLIAEEKLDFVIFLRDPLTSQPHEPDVNALIRLCDVYDIPLATNIGTAYLILETFFPQNKLEKE